MYDAKDQVLGRAASEIASILLGKYTATYTPGVQSQQRVVVINAEKIKVTGNKKQDKMYYRHSGYPGGLKRQIFKPYQTRSLLKHCV